MSSRVEIRSSDDESQFFPANHVFSVRAPLYLDPMVFSVKKVTAGLAGATDFVIDALTLGEYGFQCDAEALPVTGGCRSEGRLRRDARVSLQAGSGRHLIAAPSRLG